MAAPASERLTAARAAVDRACKLLLSPSPQQMDDCGRLLETAILEVRNFYDPNHWGDPVNGTESREALAEARLLKISIDRTARLLQGGAAFYCNWIRCLSALCAGYTGQGEPATLERGARLLARG